MQTNLDVEKALCVTNESVAVVARGMLECNLPDERVAEHSDNLIQYFMDFLLSDNCQSMDIRHSVVISECSRLEGRMKQLRLKLELIKNNSLYGTAKKEHNIKKLFEELDERLSEEQVKDRCDGNEKHLLRLLSNRFENEENKRPSFKR